MDVLYICVVQYAFTTIVIKNNQTKKWNLSLTVFDLTSSPPASIKALLLSLIISCPALLLYVSQDNYHYHKTMACSVFFKHSLLLLYSRHVSSYHSSCSYIMRKGVLFNSTISRKLHAMYICNMADEAKKRQQLQLMFPFPFGFLCLLAGGRVKIDAFLPK